MTTQQNIIKTALELFQTNGYHNTSMDDIASACAIKKPSLYYHIDSREALVIDVLKQYHQHFKQSVLNLAKDSAYTPQDRLERMGTETIRFYRQHKGTCLAQKLAIEIADTIPEVYNLAKTFFKDWSQAIRTLLKNKYDAQKAKQLSDEAVSQMIGALTLGQLSRSLKLLERSAQNLNGLL